VIVEDRVEALVAQFVYECGKPLRFARAELARTVFTLRIGAYEVLCLAGMEVFIDVDFCGNGRIVMMRWVLKEFMAGFLSFNYLLNLVAHKFSPLFDHGLSLDGVEGGALKPVVCFLPLGNPA